MIDKNKIEKVKKENKKKVESVKSKNVKVKNVKKQQVLIIQADKNECKNENKYSDKLKCLINKIKSHTLETDDKIRFGWKH